MKSRHFISSILLTAAMLCTSFFCLVLPTETVKAADRSSYVIVIDPGHDELHDRNTLVSSGIHETTYNMNIANCLKAYLESYGFAVRMTRTTPACPAGGGDEKLCLESRAAIAASYGCDLLVSVHHNASGNDIYDFHEPNGSAIYISTYYQHLLSPLALDISENLRDYCDLAIRTPTGWARPTESGQTYSDGTPKDYYGIIRNSVMSGFPAIIIEHGFSDNAHDSYQRKNLGADCYALADAQAILKWYKDTYESPVSTTSTASGSSYSGIGVAGHLSIEGVNLRSEASIDAPLVAKLYANDTITLYEKTNHYYRVAAYHDGQTYYGYAHEDYVVAGNQEFLPEGRSAYVNYAWLNLRGGASTDADIYVKLSEGDTLTLYEKTSDGWFHAAAVHEGVVYTGYLSCDYVAWN